MKTIKTITLSKIKNNLDALLKLLLVHERVAVVNNNKTRFIVFNPNREEIAQELRGWI